MAGEPQPEMIPPHATIGVHTGNQMKRLSLFSARVTAIITDRIVGSLGWLLSKVSPVTEAMFIHWCELPSRWDAWVDDTHTGRTLTVRMGRFELQAWWEVKQIASAK